MSSTYPNLISFVGYVSGYYIVTDTDMIFLDIGNGVELDR